MTTETTIDVSQIRRLRRDTDAADIATAAYGELTTMLATLAPNAWAQRVPDCPAWTVADTVGHMIGAAKSHASIRETIRQQRIARATAAQHDGNGLDAINALQVADHAGLAPAERLAALEEVAGPAVAGRIRTPGLLRRVQIPIDAGGSTATGMPPKVQMGHLMDAILTRDVWLHRIDIARALDLDPNVTSAADQRVVEDVVAEWAGRHGQPFTLTLTGPVGGRFRHGAGGPDLEYDAVEFCRTLSGRAPAEGLLATRVLF